MRSKWLMAFLLLLAIGVTGSITGCNTTAGVGKDISSTGDAITRTAEDNR